MKKTKIVIIGAGIAGLTAAIYLKLAHIDFVIFENNLVGGKLNELKTIENFPAAGKTTGKEMLNSLLTQCKKFNIHIGYCNVQTILNSPNGFEIKTDKDSYLSEKIILATGINKINSLLPGEEKYFGKGVSYCAVCDGNFFKGVPVAVIGNSLTAFEEANYLSNLSSKVFLITNGNKVDDNELTSSIINNSKIELITKGKVQEIVGDDFGVTKIIINNKDIMVNGVFPYIGVKNTTQILNNLNPKTDGNFIVVDEKMMTSIKNLYACGDVNNHKLKQLVTACNDAVIAAVNASEVNI